MQLLFDVNPHMRVICLDRVAPTYQNCFRNTQAHALSNVLVMLFLHTSQISLLVRFDFQQEWRSRKAIIPWSSVLKLTVNLRLCFRHTSFAVAVDALRSKDDVKIKSQRHTPSSGPTITRVSNRSELTDRSSVLLLTFKLPTHELYLSIHYSYASLEAVIET